MIQVFGLLKYADLYDFLQNVNTELSNEVYNVYIESMNKTLYNLFRTYHAQLSHPTAIFIHHSLSDCGDRPCTDHVADENHQGAHAKQ